ncbi:hypothetical protein A3B45_03075 [Candidatus Daviesbacteria bacterium RIFCSPLOWO2_01_FULL_39_12]|uniref:Uncharacterized protein n=1 Tax=Candidatus Daviesbacteria bacterium RIFCSPLOWO2_01_FULL_39_12 TaxID=1797785 RepID=A0A1F5KSV3_9BACT|nr:MAG: hypothetical protein A3D79_01610 [Candidatus Daviesbacteria bacterium RIFCSPHIGHO2_02_FULL_39_8]OGE44003.1 MAG: hypothetical protein A3B45_03075 [Candidatus Daviesbacteria bacterium RIFCSPLOWO2_01_FULL_39_12]
MPKSEFEKLWGWVAVPYEVRFTKGAWNEGHPVVNSPRSDTNGSISGMGPLPYEVRRLNSIFVQGHRRRVNERIEHYSGETAVMSWERMTKGGRFSPRRDSHICHGRRYWDDELVPGSILRAMRALRDYPTEPRELDSGEDGVEEADWSSLVRVNDGLKPPTIASMINPQLLQQLQALTT